MLRDKLPAIAITTLVFGVATLGWARMAPGEERSIPYQGVLERDGVALTGTVTARFALFPSATADTSCVLTNTCPLWSEEQDIDVDNGRFAVVLGDGTGPTTLSDTVLATPALFLAVAVKADGDADFTALAGVQEILPVPLSARAALADRAAQAGLATSVAANGVGTAAIVPGAVTADRLAQNLFFSANVVFDGTNYTATNQGPAGWISQVLVVNQNSAALIATSRPIPPVKCTVTPIEEPRHMTIDGVNSQFIAIGVRHPLDLSGLPGSFTLLCLGF